MEHAQRTQPEVQKKETQTHSLFVPIETSKLSDEEQLKIGERKTYFQQLVEKVGGEKEKELLLFSTIIVEQTNAWIEKFNSDAVASLTALDDLEKFCDWYCQPLEARSKAATILSYPFSDIVRFTAVLALGKVAYLVREASKDENKGKRIRKVLSLHGFFQKEAQELFEPPVFSTMSAAD